MAKRKKKRDGAAAGIGHNNVAAEQLRSFVQRIERLREEKAALTEDIREVYSELKGEGFEAKIVRKIVAQRERDQQEVREEEELMELYLAALGDLPLFQSVSEVPDGDPGDEPKEEEPAAASPKKDARPRFATV